MLRRTERVPARPPLPPPVVDPATGRRRRRKGGKATTALLLLFALVFLAVAVLRVIGVDGNEITVPALTLTPYIAPGGLLLALIAFGLRRRIMAAAVLLLALSMVFLLAARVLPNDQPAARGEHLRILTANVHAGAADPAALANLVRNNQVDVLTLPELTPEELPALDAAGLAELLPNRVVDPRPGGIGSGILSRYPLRQTVLVDVSTLAEPSAVVDLPGRNDVEVLATHIQAVAHSDVTVWRRGLAQLPPTAPDRVRVLAGDFNATLDHAAFRAVLDRGYVDAADQTGKGLTPTWASAPFGPPITIDHVLADHRAAVQSFAVLHLPGSDHNAVFADLQLPN
jgi:endonuclease/exonuclease/phosphatase (EEP) superfamily protein YafD